MVVDMPFSTKPTGSVPSNTIEFHHVAIAAVKCAAIQNRPNDEPLPFDASIHNASNESPDLKTTAT